MFLNLERSPCLLFVPVFQDTSLSLSPILQSEGTGSFIEVKPGKTLIIRLVIFESCLFHSISYLWDSFMIAWVRFVAFFQWRKKDTSLESSTWKLVHESIKKWQYVKIQGPNILKFLATDFILNGAVLHFAHSRLDSLLLLLSILVNRLSEGKHAALAWGS